MKTTKKLLAFTLAAALALSLVACGGKDKKVELTTENIEEYLTISNEVVSSNIDTRSSSPIGFRIYSFSGESKIKVETMKQSDVNFEDVTITCRLYYTNSPKFGWEFKSGNIKSDETFDLTGAPEENSKTVKLTIPFDGSASIEESLELALYVDGKDLQVMKPYEMDFFSIEITEVTGNVIIN